MKEFTKKERNAIYKEALIWAKADKSYPYGICHWIINSVYSLGYGVCEANIIDNMPEIKKHEPEIYYNDIVYQDVYWFDPKDKEIRIDIIKQAIKETEQ